MEGEKLRRVGWRYYSLAESEYNLLCFGEERDEMKKMEGEKLDPRNGAAGTDCESGRILNGRRAGGVA